MPKHRATSAYEASLPFASGRGNLRLSPFDDAGVAAVGIMCRGGDHEGPHRTLPCQDCVAGWHFSDGVATCRESSAVRPDGNCSTCELDPLRFYAKGPCESCIGPPSTLNGRCFCD